MALTVGELRDLLEFIEPNTPVITIDSTYGHEDATAAEFRFIKRRNDLIVITPEDDDITSEIGLVIW